MNNLMMEKQQQYEIKNQAHQGQSKGLSYAFHPGSKGASPDEAKGHSAVNVSLSPQEQRRLQISDIEPDRSEHLPPLKEVFFGS